MMNRLKEYWDGRYEQGGMIWGEEPSRSALLAAECFKKGGLTDLIVGGCGYGRHSLYFARQGFKCLGLDISPGAIELARESGADFIAAGSLDYRVVDMTAGEIELPACEAFFAFNLIHLLHPLSQRERVYRVVQRALAAGGMAFFTVMSRDDESYGKGKMLGEGCFESKPGRAVLYFNHYTLKEELSTFFEVDSIIDIAEPEEHGGSRHLHKLLAARCSLK